MDNKEIKEIVRTTYGKIAKGLPNAGAVAVNQIVRNLLNPLDIQKKN
jgi:hypothetical protein